MGKRELNTEIHKEALVRSYFSLLAYYNGIYWKELCGFNEIGLFYSMDFKDNNAITVGENDRRAIIYIEKIMILIFCINGHIIILQTSCFSKYSLNYSYYRFRQII